jgi:hypothetical protein
LVPRLTLASARPSVLCLLVPFLCNQVGKQCSLQNDIKKAQSMAELNPLASTFLRPRAVALFIVMVIDAVFVGLDYKTVQENQAIRGVPATYIVEILALVFAVLAFASTAWQMFGLSRVGLISVIVSYAGKSALSWAFIGTFIGFFGWVQSQTANLVLNIIFGTAFAFFAFTAVVLYQQFDRVSHIPGGPAADAEEAAGGETKGAPSSTGMTRL